MIFDKASGKLLVIAGPCSLESHELAFGVAQEVARLRDKYAKDAIFVFKGSFDKANRTSLNSPRGVGLEEGMEIFSNRKKSFGMPVITDVHETWQCAKVAETVDVLQIPAFLCRQTDLLVAAAKTGRAVNVKKGQFLSPQEMKFVVDKLRGAGAVEIWQTERGSSFGYQNLVVDMRSFTVMKENLAPVIMDATHATQMPGAGGGVSSGDRRFVPQLARAAVAAGADGLFLETHPEPEKALSDAATQLPLSKLDLLVASCIRIHKAIAQDC